MNWLGRLAEERAQLQDRIDKLRLFVRSDFFSSLSDEDQEDLHDQLVHMQRYYAVLVSRLARHST